MNGLTYDPNVTAIRETLECARSAGRSFDDAFLLATGGKPRQDSAALWPFMRKHFKAAYEGDGSDRGHFMVAQRDTSSAIPVLTFIDGKNPGRDAEIIEAVRSGQTCQVVGDAYGLSMARVASIAQRGNVVLPKAMHDHERCRSGDGCDRLATCGRFGRMWCEYHGAELERLADDVRITRRKADPRNGGNNSLFTHQAA